MKISIGPSATAAEKNAATALQNYLARMKIFDAASLSFAVGPEAARAAGVRAGDLRGLGDEGYVIIRRAGGKIILTGGPGSKRGALYAVFCFLERVCGCRWWTADVDFVPTGPRRLPRSLDIREIPDIELRTTDFWYGRNPKWMAANRINSGDAPDEWGGGRVALAVTNAGADFSEYSGQVQAFGSSGGSAGAGAGAGTIYWRRAEDCKGNKTNGTVVVANNNAGYYTDVPPALHDVPDEVNFVAFIVSNSATLRLTDDFIIGDLYLRSAEACLDLGGKTLKIRSREHQIGPDEPPNVLNYGEIIWWPDIPKGALFSIW